MASSKGGVATSTAAVAARASDMEKMSIEQLKGIKEQTDLEVNLLQDSLNNIKTATGRLEVAATSLKDLSLRPQGKKMLVPLTASLYAPGTLDDADRVLVDIGTGYFVEKTMNEGKDYCERKINLLKCNFDQLIESYHFNESGSDHKLNKRVSPANANIERISERYDISSVPRFSSASISVVDESGRNYRARSFHATPTASSEASWNSQTGLLSNPPGAVAVSMRNPPRKDDTKKGSGTKWLLWIKCPCSGKKSVQIEEKISEARTPSRINHAQVCSDLKKQIQNQIPITVEKSLATPDWLERREVIPSTHRISADNKLQRREVIPNSHRISEDSNQFPSGSSHHLVVASARPFSTDSTSGFSFPALSQTPPPIKLVLPSATYNPPLEDPPRDSLDVFRLGDDPIPTRSNSDLHRRQSFLIIDDDMASDASSDLFEIESFSTQTSYGMCPNRRDSLDDASSFNARRLAATIGGNLYCRSLNDPRTPSIAPTESYEPSKASIDWSVTAAEGFDRGSVANFPVSESEVDEMPMMP